MAIISGSGLLRSSNDILDRITGLSANDTVVYASATSAVNVSLSIVGAQITGGSGFDELISIENIIGSSFNDTLQGNGGANVLDGSGGIDTANYGNATGGVTLSLSLAGPQATGGAGSDTLINIENLIGSRFADLLTGSDSINNVLIGGEGNDTFIGTSGSDVIDGGLDSDVVSYSAYANTISLGAFGVVNKGFGNIDSLVGVEAIIGSSLVGDTVDHSGASVAPATGTVTNLTTGVVTVNGTGTPLPLTFSVRQFENVIGSGFADTITGNGANNSLSGGAGTDTFFGSAGNDTLNGGDDVDTVSYSALGTVVTLGAFGVLNKGSLGTDRLIGVESIVGSSLLGDTVDHSGASVAPATGTVTNLTTGAVTVNGTTSPLPLTLTVSQFENVIGSGFADTITGNADNNSLSGGAGTDTFFGSAGNDTLNGGDDTDTASYNALGTVVTLGAFGVLNKGSLGTDRLIGVESIVGSSLLGDTVDHSAAVGPATGTSTNLETGLVRVNGTVSPLPLTFSVRQFENVVGSSFADSITGDSSNNLLIGGGGNDTLNGGGGNDQIIADTLSLPTGLVFTYNNKTYSLTSAGSWTQAQAEAVALGGNLVAINDAAENQFIVDAFGSNERFWIGYTDAVKEGDFKWVNGDDSTYTNWAPSEPNDAGGNEDYAEINFGGIGKWNDLPNTLVSLRGIVEFATSNDSVIGSSGNDTINGGIGLDTVDYSALGGTVSLGAFGVVTKGLLGTDSLVGVETIVGSSLLGDTVDHSAAVSSGGVSVTGTTTNLITGAVTVNGTGAPLPLSFTVQQFENVIGSNFNDSITSNSTNNSLSGGLGNDTFIGSAGRDTINGGDGLDLVDYSSLGCPVTLGAFGVLNKGGLGLDSLVGIETVIGSSGSGDTVDHSAAVSSGGVNVTGTTTNLTTGAVTVNGTGVPLPLSFTVQQFENVIGSNFNDSLTGNGANNVLSGGLGNDSFFGSAGNDTVNGGDGSDTADYSALGGPVTLAAFGLLNKGGLGSDSLVGIETVVGSSGSGDTVDHSAAVSTGAVTVTGTTTNLTTGAVSVNGTGAPLPLSFAVQQFENVIGSNFNDSITGNRGNNSLSAGLGNDTIFASAGNDTLNGGLGSDTANYSALAGPVSLGAFGVLNKGGLGIDTLVAVETIVGSSLQGDTVDHSGTVGPATGTTTNLASGLVTVSGTGSPFPLGFTVQQFENVIGSSFNDSITGDGGNNLLVGGGGSDTLNGGGGNDQIFADGSLAITGPGFVYNNKFYALTSAGSWTETQAQAVAMGGNLVTINDGAENQFLVDSFGGKERLWIGFTDVVKEGSFKWVNGDVSSYTNWAAGEPNDAGGNEDFAEFNFGGAGKWNDLPNLLVPLRGIVEFENPNDSIIGSTGNDTINGGIGLDTIDYSSLGGTVSLGAFGVLNKGVLGTDSLVGIETIVGSSLLGDTIDHSAAVSSGTATLTGTTTNLLTGAVTVNGTGSPLPLSFSTSGFENVIGSGLADAITGGNGNNVLSGGAGNDTISGGSGEDTITGGAGKDQLTGDAGNDSFVYAALADSLLANYDVITDYSLGDILDRPGAGVTLNASSGIAFGLSAAQVGSILNVFSFTPGSTRAFTAVGFSGTFIAFNDATAGFNELSDSILHLVSYNISASNPVTIA